MAFLYSNNIAIYLNVVQVFVCMWMQDAPVARLSSDKLGGDPESGSASGPCRGSCDWIHGESHTYYMNKKVFVY